MTMGARKQSRRRKRVRVSSGEIWYARSSSSVDDSSMSLTAYERPVGANCPFSASCSLAIAEEVVDILLENKRRREGIVGDGVEGGLVEGRSRVLGG